MDSSIDFQPYLDSICHSYAEWLKLYTLTDIEGKSVGSSDQNKQVALFDFGLMMQSSNTRKPEVSQQEKTEKRERRPVLDGLRKSLAEAKHILLIGRPGSGKSTALARLLLEESQHCLREPYGNYKVPVLVELRYYQTTVFDLIREFFKRHNLSLETHQIEALLSKNQLLLLIDGLNELSSKSARQDITKLRNYRHVSMIFTTRDLSLGGDFGIEKQWEMLPLTEPQMKEFIKAHLSPGQVDAMWRQLQARTRKLAETPLLLWMLCELFAVGEAIPHNLGEIFRKFTKVYENSSIRKHEVAALKGDVQPLSDRRLWFSALKHLAYLMMQGEAPVDARNVISREEAEEELKALFSEEASPTEAARNCLDDLLNYHLLQIKSGDEIEFRHQLFQEYYAAEWLRQRLSNLTDEQLKYYFLNYLKWTESIALMLGLLDNEIQILQLIRLALHVDLFLGAKLAGSTQPKFQAKTVSLIRELQIPQPLKIMLLGSTVVDSAIDYLQRALETENLTTRTRAIEALTQIGSEATVPSLIKATQDAVYEIRLKAVEALAEIGSEASIVPLVEMIDNEEDFYNRSYIKDIIGAGLKRVNDEAITSYLYESLQDAQISIRTRAIEVIDILDKKTAIDLLLTALRDQCHEVGWKAAYTLAKVCKESAIDFLVETFKSEDNGIRKRVVYSLGEIKSTSSIEPLLPALDDKDDKIRVLVIEALGKIDSELVIQPLLKALKDKDIQVRRQAIRSLERTRNQSATQLLLDYLHDEDAEIREETAYALGEIGEDGLTEILMQALKNEEDAEVRSQLIIALGKIGSGISVDVLEEFLEDPNFEVRREAAYVLGILGNNRSKDDIADEDEDEDDWLKWESLSFKQINLDEEEFESDEEKFEGNEEDFFEAITNNEYFERTYIPSELLKSIFPDNEFFGNENLDDLLEENLVTAYDLMEFSNAANALPLLIGLLLEEGVKDVMTVIFEIQKEYKTYNYNIFQSPPPPPVKTDRLLLYCPPTYIFHAPVGNVANTVYGNQITSQQAEMNKQE